MSDYADRAGRRAAGAVVHHGAQDFSDVERVVLSRGHGDYKAEMEAASLRYFHAPERGKVELVVICDEPVRYTSHYVRERRRHVPCAGEGNCRWCGKLGSQERYMMAVRVPGDARAWIWEYSCHVVKHVEAARSAAGADEWPGLRLIVYRYPEGSNTPVYVDPVEDNPFDDEATVGGVYGEAWEMVAKRAIVLNLGGR